MKVIVYVQMVLGEIICDVNGGYKHCTILVVKKTSCVVNLQLFHSVVLRAVYLLWLVC